MNIGLSSGSVLYPEVQGGVLVLIFLGVIGVGTVSVVVGRVVGVNVSVPVTWYMSLCSCII